MAETTEKAEKEVKAKSAKAKTAAAKPASKTTTKKSTSTKTAVKAEKVTKTAAPKVKASPKKSTAAKASAVKEEGEKKAPAKKTPKPRIKAKVAEPIIDDSATSEPVESKAKKIEAVIQEPFNWESFSKTGEIYSPKEQKELEAMYDDTLSSISVQDVIDGVIVSITGKEVVVNIGYKSDGVISLSELRYRKDLKVADTIEVFVESQEDKNGQLILSHLKARALRAWERVNEALATQEIIKGHVKCRTKGGLIVDVFGIEAFLPGSQIDVKPIRDYDIYVDKTMEFKVVKINKEFKNVVVSHKALIEAELEEQKKQIISKLEKGQVLEGTVKNITSYGVFVDLGGVDGLIHITDLSWGRINHPEEIVQLDQKINVVILDFDDEKKRIALGLKQLQDHPWDKLDESLKVGDEVKGKVVVVADYGAFVEIQPGVEGLIHVSEISWSNHLKPAQEFFKVGDEVQAKVLTLDKEDRKMSLGIKQLTPDPWEGIETNFPVESRHNGKVTNISDFGVFVELSDGVDGLIHISDLSWSRKVNHPSEITKVGEDIEVVILEIDKENRRLSLGHKQLEENPWEVFESVFGVGTVHQGTIIEVTKRNAVVSLPYGVEGLCVLKNLIKEDGSTAANEETLDFKVLDFNKNARKITVSHSHTFKSDDAPESKGKGTKDKSSSKAVKKINDSQEKTTLGDLDVLGDLKTKLEKGEKSK
ncbi:MAG: 30S ribosomal protein S1 [Vicingaceae bacterium]